MIEKNDASRCVRAAMMLVGLIGLMTISGCTAGTRGDWSGPKTLSTVGFEEWGYEGNRGYIARSTHYVIYTTIEDKEVIGRLSQLMEGAYQRYQAFFPISKAEDKPMECYIFARRAEWESFTKQITGPDAAVYLRINRGGYAIRDRFVAWMIGEGQTHSVAAHEGWHQYRAHYFQSVLPPFIEEGTATQFEYMRWENGLPIWNMAVNFNRETHIREAVENNTLWPLEKLVRMHAGNIVGATGEKIEAFYSQNWAFVRFMMDGADGKYHSGFNRLLSDTAAGETFNPESGRTHATLGFRPDQVPKILEHYLGADMATISKDYLAYIRKI